MLHYSLANIIQFARLFFGFRHPSKAAVEACEISLRWFVFRFFSFSSPAAFAIVGVLINSDSVQSINRDGAQIAVFIIDKKSWKCFFLCWTPRRNENWKVAQHFVLIFRSFPPLQVNISNTWTLPQPGFNVFYRYFRDKISWFEADAVCQFHHANLVTGNYADSGF